MSSCIISRYLHIIHTPYCRNRCKEVKANNIPAITEHYEGNDGLGLTAREIAYMVEHETLQLPRNMFRRFIRSPKGEKHWALEYVGFTVRNCFPNNIVLLKDGSLMYVTEIRPGNIEDGADEETRDYFIHGYFFSQVIQ